MKIEERLLSYPTLSPEEKEEVEAYVEDHPEWEPLLHAVQRLAVWVEITRERSVPSHEDVLGLYVIAERARPDQIAPEFASVFERLEEQLADDPDLRRRYEEAQERLRDLEASFDPVAHFESLTGYSLSDDDADDAPPDADPPQDRSPDGNGASPAPDKPPQARSGGAASSQAESPQPSASHASGVQREAHDEQSSFSLHVLPRAIRWAAAAVVLLAAGYGALFGMSQATQSPLLALADMRVEQDVLESYPLRTRSAAPAERTASPDDLYLQALPLLKNARQTTLGLFPTYDTEALQRAETLLNDVVDQSTPESFLWGEALFYLGKVHLAKREVAQARSTLQRVAQSDTRRSDEAYELLVRLQSVAPAEDPSS